MGQGDFKIICDYFMLNEKEIFFLQTLLLLSPSQLQHYYHCFHNKVVEDHILFNAFVSCLTLSRQICGKRRVTPFRQILAGHPVPYGDLF